jgi:hypothetical protein
MKLFCTSSVAVVNDCQRYFNFLPINYQIDIRTSCFLEKLSTLSYNICQLFKSCAQEDLRGILLALSGTVKSPNATRYINCFMPVSECVLSYDLVYSVD